MNEFAGTSPWTAITKDVQRKRRGPIVAAISYVGVKAPEVLPLRQGDFLICDASERAIKQGVTSAKALGWYLRAGVQVFSHEGLHSKVVATETFAWVGSANASSNSRDNLTEASVRIEGPACRASFNWAYSLATEDTELSAKDVRGLAKLPVSWKARGGEPSRSKKVLELPKDLKKIVIVELPYETTDGMNREIEKRKISVKKSLVSHASKLDCFVWETRPRAEVGDVVIAVMNNRVTRPWRIVQISALPGYKIFWYQALQTPIKARISELRDAVTSMEKDFDIKVISDRKTILKIRKLYGV